MLLPYLAREEGRRTEESGAGILLQFNLQAVSELIEQPATEARDALVKYAGGDGKRTLATRWH
jgi:hypothetical protein